MNRVFGGYAKRIDAPWKMYPVGVLFGLGAGRGVGGWCGQLASAG